MRIGVGVDIHQLRTGQVMYLAGLSWPHKENGRKRIKKTRGRKEGEEIKNRKR